MADCQVTHVTRDQWGRTLELRNDSVPGGVPPRTASVTSRRDRTRITSSGGTLAELTFMSRMDQQENTFGPIMTGRNATT